MSLCPGRGPIHPRVLVCQCVPKPVRVTCLVGTWRKPQGGCILSVGKHMLRDEHLDLNQNCKKEYLECFTYEGKSLAEYMAERGMFT